MRKLRHNWRVVKAEWESRLPGSRSCFPHCETPQPLADGCQHGEQGEDWSSTVPEKVGSEATGKGPSSWALSLVEVYLL